MALEELHLSDFAAQLNTTFRVREPRAADLELVEIVNHMRKDDGGPVAESFSLTFRGPADVLLEQQIYRVDHPALGSFELFLVPTGRDRNGYCYEAVFNRLR